jgi:malate dehydrogenase (oxaloacetate-decarboxylating)
MTLSVDVSKLRNLYNSYLMDINKEALKLHAKHKGKIGLFVKTPIRNRTDLSLAYTPGVAAVSRAIAKDKNKVYDYTSKANTVAIVTDGTAVLGLGDIGPEAALPVMEGKAILMKEFADVDAYPLCLATKDVDEIVAIVKAISPGFGAINLEDISAPRCFEVEERLKKELDIPVFHDDQHGTAIVVLAGLINACEVTKRKLADSKIVISGAGAAGIAVGKILLARGVKNIVMANSRGIINKKMKDLNWAQEEMTRLTNPNHEAGTLKDALKNADVFIGVSAPNIIAAKDVSFMNKDAIVFALANPTPEIMPEEARKGGAAVIATGRSDYPNQVNNVLAFPGVFRGALDSRAKEVTENMKLMAAKALADYVKKPNPTNIISDVLDKKVVKIVARAVKGAG